jgi:hypothetical protein
VKSYRFTLVKWWKPLHSGPKLLTSVWKSKCMALANLFQRR